MNGINWGLWWALGADAGPGLILELEEGRSAPCDLHVTVPLTFTSFLFALINLISPPIVVEASHSCKSIVWMLKNYSLHCTEKSVAGDFLCCQLEVFIVALDKKVYFYNIVYHSVSNITISFLYYNSYETSSETYLQRPPTESWPQLLRPLPNTSQKE